MKRCDFDLITVGGGLGGCLPGRVDEQFKNPSKFADQTPSGRKWCVWLPET